MSEPAPPMFESLIRLRRQRALGRVVDAFVPSMIAATVAAIAATMFDGPGVFVALVTMIIGLSIAICLRPTLLQTAAAFDAAHGLDDLVSSAVLMPATGDAWATTIRNLAGHKLATLPAPPARYFSARAITAVSMVCLSALLTTTLFNDHSEESAAVTSPKFSAEVDPFFAIRSLDSPNGLRTRDAESELAGQTDSQRTDDHGNRTDPSASSDQPAGNASGTGRADAGAAVRSPEITFDPARNSTESPDGPRTSGGDGRAKPDTSGQSTAAGRVGVSRRDIPPWSAADWPARVSAANALVNNGRVPEAYRELVQDYFDR